jgi:uncharacterized YccA/Bax inhibitor family protein
MSNPVLNAETFESARTTWAPPQGPPQQPVTGIDDGPISAWRPTGMTINGTIRATAVLFALLLAGAAVGWAMVGEPSIVIRNGIAYEQSAIPALAWGGLIVGVGLTFLLMFKPRLAPYVAPVYAVVEGVFLGAVSRGYENAWDGIVVQAAGATIAVFGVMLALYRTRIIKVTERFRTVVTAATIGVMVFYGVSLLIRLVAGADSIRFLSSPSLLGIGLSVLVAGLAAFNLALDFDFIERGERQRLDKRFEWYAAFGLLVTIVWLYLELLRLLSKLRSR